MTFACARCGRQWRQFAFLLRCWKADGVHPKKETHDRLSPLRR